MCVYILFSPTTFPHFSLYTVREKLYSRPTRLQGPTVKGLVSETCDAYQASNVDGYFAVTAHWIEENADGTWSEQAALIGFVRMNNSHNGVRLGQALFKIAARVGIVHKVFELLSSL